MVAYVNKDAVHLEISPLTVVKPALLRNRTTYKYS